MDETRVAETLLARFRQGDRLALARLLSLAARGEIGTQVLSQLPPATKPARVVAVTGSGGVGKSTLIGKLIQHLRAQNLKVAVLACDPQSQLSGGALLGDRFRMPSQPDDGVFIRSLAALSGRGAVAEHLPLLVQLLGRYGFDVILIETAGAGQGDTAVREVADVVLLLLQPETGDDLQWEKAGVLEVADVVAIHKADLPGAEQAAAQVRAALDLTSGAPTPLIKVSSKTGEGVAALWEAVAACPPRGGSSNGAYDLLRLAQDALAARFVRAQSAHDPALKDVLQRWRDGELRNEDAVSAVLRALQRTP
jgi:LAO/AO transport system ATPase